MKLCLKCTLVQFTLCKQVREAAEKRYFFNERPNKEGGGWERANHYVKKKFDGINLEGVGVKAIIVAS